MVRATDSNEPHKLLELNPTITELNLPEFFSSRARVAKYLAQRLASLVKFIYIYIYVYVF